MAQYRDSGQIICLPDVHSFAQSFASSNSSYLARRSIPVSVTGIRVNETTHVVGVTVAADLSPLLPGLLQAGAHVTMTGYAEARIDGR